MVLSHVQSSAEPLAEAIRKLGLRSYAAFPLLIGDRLLGTVAFGSYGRDLIASDEIAFLRTVSQYVAVTIDRAQRDQALHEAQATLTRHADILETKVAERTSRLRETIEELEGFSHTVAHDLRAPIRWLSGYAELLLTEYHDALPPEARAIVERLRQAGLRLDALTRDLLSISKVARQDVKLVPVDAAEIVESVVSVTPSFQGGAVLFEGRSARVMAQRTLLQQCLANLLDNALKFARPGVPPLVVVRAEARGASAGQPLAHTLTPLFPPPPAAAGASASTTDTRSVVPAEALEGVDAVTLLEPWAVRELRVCWRKDASRQSDHVRALLKQLCDRAVA